MSTIKNQVQLIGNVGADPQVNTLDGGRQVANLSLATNINYRDSQGTRQTETAWHRVVAWNGTAKIIGDYVKKGSLIAVQGRIKTNAYTDNEGNQRYSTEIVADEILLLHSKDSD